MHAIEIGPAMAAKLRSNVTSDRLRVSVGDFEQLRIVDGAPTWSVSATAYHWIGPVARTERPATILRPGGVFAVVELVQVDSPSDGGFFAAVQPIYDRYGQGHTGPPAPTRAHVDPAIRAVMEDDGRFVQVDVRRYDWDQTYNAATTGS